MNSLTKITKLLSRGEKIIVVDEQAEPQFVVMDIDEYEKIINNNIKGLTEEELLAKINCDIAIWKSTREVDETAVEIEDLKESNNWEDDEEDYNDDKYYFEPVDEEDEE